MKTKIEQFSATNPNPVLCIAKDGTVVYSNITGESLLHEWGIRVGEKLTIQIGDLVQTVISRNIPEKMEIKVGNKVYLVEFHLSPEDECINVYGFDISDQKKLEEKLRESEEKYRNIVEIANEGIWTLNSEARTTYVNGKMAEMLGYSQEEMIGRPVWDFADEEGKSILKLSMEKRQQGVNDVYEFKLICKDGSPLWVLISGKSFFSKDGKFTGSLGMLSDITQRKKADVKLKETLENLEKLVEERTEELEKAYNSLKESEKGLSEAQKMAHMGNWIWNIVTDEAYWSDELYHVFERSPQEPAPTYNEYLNYIHPDDRYYVAKAFNKAINGKPYSIDHRIILANGEERTVHIQSEVVFDEKNTPIRVKGIVQDITERKKAEEMLAKAEDARKKEIHHRIKNNLQVISSLLDLQAEKFSCRETVPTREILEAFRESQNRVISMSLIHEELYRTDGTDKLDFSAYLRKLVQTLFQTYSLRGKSICLYMDLENNAFLNIDTAIPLGIIVNELVSNSLKHAFKERAEGNINIKLCREKKAEDTKIQDESKSKGFESTSFILVVSDDGIGISESLDLENLDTLGFQLVVSLVDQLDGELELKTSHGTEITIRFKVTETSKHSSLLK